MSDDECTPEHQEKTSAAGTGGRALVERIFGALAHKRRRYVLYCLQDQEHMQVDDLATQLTAWEQGVPSDAVSRAARDDVQASLVHTHLPKLADYNLIAYDRRSGAVRSTNAPTLITEVLALTARIEKPE